MVDERLSAYVKEHLAAGYPPQQLREALTSQGWPISDVEAALHAAQPTQAPVPAIPSRNAEPVASAASSTEFDTAFEKPRMPVWKHALIVTAMVLVLCAIGGTIYLLFFVNA